MRALGGWRGSLLQLGRQYIDADVEPHLFRSLGFDERSVRAMDLQGSDFNHDLNEAIDVRDAFDCVLDGGTLEHVFDIAQAMRNVFTMLKVGGRAVHISPTNNLVDHGFYSFSPTFFADYYGQNNWTILKHYTFCADSWSSPWLPYNGSDGGRLVGTFCVAEKRADSTSRSPIQKIYR